MMTTCRPLPQAALINTAAESKSAHLTPKTRVYRRTPLCVSTLQTGFSVIRSMPQVFFVGLCGNVKATHELALR